LSQEEEEKKAFDDREDDQKIVAFTEKSKPKSLIKVPLSDTSIHDLLVCIENMSDFDRILHDLGVISERDWAPENTVLESVGKSYVDKHTFKPKIPDYCHYSNESEI
jgi:hypothetical protein